MAERIALSEGVFLSGEPEAVKALQDLVLGADYLRKRTGELRAMAVQAATVLPTLRPVIADTDDALRIYDAARGPVT